MQENICRWNFCRWIAESWYMQENICRWISTGGHLQMDICRYISVGGYLQVDICRWIFAGGYSFSQNSFLVSSCLEHESGILTSLNVLCKTPILIFLNQFSFSSQDSEILNSIDGRHWYWKQEKQKSNEIWTYTLDFVFPADSWYWSILVTWGYCW